MVLGFMAHCCGKPQTPLIWKEEEVNNKPIWAASLGRSYKAAAHRPDIKTVDRLTWSASGVT